MLFQVHGVLKYCTEREIYFSFQAEYLFKKNPEGRMFEPDYTETMSMLLDAIGRQQNDVLPREGLADVAQFLKRQDELSTTDKMEKSEMQNVGREADAMSILEQTFEYEGTGDSKKEELTFAEQMADKFEGKA